MNEYKVDDQTLKSIKNIYKKSSVSAKKNAWPYDIDIVVVKEIIKDINKDINNDNI